MNFLHNIKNLTELSMQWRKIEDLDGIAGIRWLCRNDLYYLLVKVCKRTDLLKPFFYERCREVEENPDGYLDLWAREHGKSSIITFGKTLQDILINPDITVGFFSENYTLAAKFLSQIKRELEENEVLKAVFPDILYSNPQSESPIWNGDGIVVKRRGNPKEPTVECQGLLSMKVGAHYDLMVYDDIITMNSVTSPETVQKINDYFEVSLSQSKEGGRKRFIGTRYSYADTYAMIMDRQIAEQRIYPATHDGTDKGEPVLFSKEYWEQKKRENSTYNLSCQYLQNPQAGGEKVFDISLLQTYDVRPYKLNVVIVADPANSLKKGSCNTAMLVIGIGASNRKYLLDGYCHKMSLAERWTHLSGLYKKWKADPGTNQLRVGYEKYGAGNVDLDYFREQFKKEPNTPRFTIEELGSALNGSNRKRDRIERIQPDLIYNNIFLPYPTDPANYTKAQRAALQAGNPYTISSKIRRADDARRIYDLCDVFVRELDAYPYGQLVDCLDGFSRVYDMNVSGPILRGRSFSLSASELT